jgi:phosphoserine phosphatase
MSARFATVVLDVDSTVSGIEGIDWLAKRRGPEIAAEVARLTDDAMRGVIPLESVYGARLATIRPSSSDIAALAAAYQEHMAPGISGALEKMRLAGAKVVLVSGGLRPAIRPMAEALGVADADLHAVEVWFDAAGNYAAFDSASPLTTSFGKRTVLEELQLARPVFAAGDGATDVAMRAVAERFAAYAGFVRRENVVAQADVVVESFAEIAAQVLGP